MDTRENKRKNKSRTAPPERRRKPEQKEDQVVYTQAKPFNMRRFWLRLLTILAIVLALIFGLSIFFKVDKIEVYGAQKYDSWQVAEASGIDTGEGLLGINGAKISARITQKLPYVKQARVEISLPDKVKIEIVELDVSYMIQAQDDSWWLIDADGKILEQTQAESGYTQILGVQLTDPEPGQQAVAVEADPNETEPDGTTKPVTVLGRERLDAVLAILKNLESNGILGEMASVDVSDMGDIELWLGERYRIDLGDSTRLDYKVKAMKQVIDQNGDYQSGILDVSFTIWPDKVGYTPFS